MAKVVKRSPAPLYLAAVVWVVWGLFFPLYQLTHFILVIAFSLGTALVGTKLFPDKTFETPDPVEPETTGNPQLDALIAERDKAVSEMRRLNDNIPGEKISAQIDRLEEDTRKIITHVVSHPEKLGQIRKFMNYYLPTTLKLLNAYDRMGEAGVAGSNIDGTRGKIETMMDTIVSAFDKQLDALFADEALDISTDITVMENLLKQEGLQDEKPFAMGG
ncbi:MAG: 5-bromo-4-chloroindolyl phosphate hydrolysis family protein [Pseudoflavonifractor sp.]|nr:5-bromo-4-chloroindolyl phosphate hydrolysis family protein [Pseudoflavonifractor sp.]